MSDTLYGGRPGVSFVIKKAFGSVEEMVAAGKRGEEYREVWFGELCIISTVNLNHPTNGQVYRRGFDYTNDLGGFELLANIVGPQSGTPLMQLNTIKEAQNYSTQPLEEYDYRKYPIGYETDDEGHVTGYEYNTEANEPLAIFPFSKAHDTSLVPGKTDDDKFNDEIRWTWVNIRKNNEPKDSWFYVAMELVYPVFEFQSHGNGRYDSSGNLKPNPTTIDRVDDKTHPFYSKWDIGIPKGIKGDTIRNMRVIIPKSTDTIYSWDAIKVSSTDDTVTVGAAGYDGQDDDVKNKRAILVYDFYVFDKTNRPKAITIYIGDYNDIDGVTLADDGTLTIGYAHDDDKVYSKKIKWVTSVKLDTNNGKFKMDFNNGSPSLEVTLDWIKSIVLDPDGTLHYHHTKDLRDEVHENAIKWENSVSLNTDNGQYQVNYNYGDPYKTALNWVKEVKVDPDGTIHYIQTVKGDVSEKNKLKWLTNFALNEANGHLQVDYNYGEPYENNLNWVKEIKVDDDGSVHFIQTVKGDVKDPNRIKWIDAVKLDSTNGLFTVDFNYGDNYTSQLDWVSDITMDPDTGNIIIHHINSAIGDGGEVTIPAKLKIIEEASASADGVISFKTNTNETIKLKKTGTSEDFHIKHIDNVKINTGISEDKHIQVKYNTASTYDSIGDAINYIQDMVVRESDFHLLVLFTDPAHRKPTQTKGNWVNNITGSDGTAYGADIWWKDFGTIKDQAGILIGKNVTPEEVGSSATSEVLNYLDKHYPNGLTEGNTKQKIVTFGTEDGDKLFYAFDYDANKWYYLGAIGETQVRDAMLLVDGSYNDETIFNLSTKGLGFIQVNSVGKDAMPQYWSATYKK